MLITFQEDSVLRIYPSVEEAVRDVEALDAEQTFRSVFDETGQRYVIRWIRPNDRGRFIRNVVGNGQYTLAPTGGVDVDGLRKVIRDAQFVEPESLRPWLRELEGRLTSR